MSWKDVTKQDANKLFWTEVFASIDASTIESPCVILPLSKITENSPFQWSQSGNHRFFYDEMYLPDEKQIVELPGYASEYEPPEGSVTNYIRPEEPLKMMDVFSGVGGLSIGLEKSGVAKAKWAIEWDRAAAQAFKANHADCEVINDDVNKVTFNSFLC